MRPLLLLCLAGVLVRLLFLVLAWTVELQSDEGFYVYLALSWSHFGFYGDSLRYLWPPGHPFVLATALEAFGSGGINAVKLLQVLASASVGLSTMLLARRLFGDRAARIAGVLWCGYLPLIGFTHSLWTESLFLALFTPACLMILGSLLGDGGTGRVVLAGVLFAGALYIKESALYLAPALALFFVLAPYGRREGVRRGLLFLLVVAALLAPWQRHCRRVHGRFVPVGESLGENVQRGLNAGYVNFDLVPLDALRRERGLPPLRHLARSWSIAPPAGATDWQHAEEIRNLPDRLRENTRRGLAFAREHPGWLLRSRVRKLADFVTPLSFFLRAQALGLYEDTVLGRGAVARSLALVAVLSPPLVLALALLGLCLSLAPSLERRLVAVWLGYFALTALLVAMSRLRVPIMPAAIVLAAGFLARGRVVPGRAALVLAGAALAGLGLLWWITWPETRAVFAMAWEAAG